MRTLWLTLCLVIVAALVSASAAPAQDAKPLLKQDDKLTEEDPKDKVLKNSHSKAFTLKLDAGTSYRIDMTSREVDSFLRIEDANGKQLGLDDDGGGYPNARLLFKAPQDGEYRIIATTFGQAMGQLKPTGAFSLTVTVAGAVDILELRAKGISTASPAERNAIVNELKKHLEGLEGKIGTREGQMAMAAANGLERTAPKQALTAYTELGKLVAASSNQQVASMGRMLEGSARRLGLIGNSMEVKGTAFDGKEIDLAKLKGKVVLVDFWATWCGPCIAEIPRMKKMYEAYKDRGFEILAISVDQQKDVASKFMEDRMLPWPCIHDSRASGKSLSDHYGVMFIPLPILVNREGKVVSLSARGPELEQLLEKHIGPLEKEKQ